MNIVLKLLQLLLFLTPVAVFAVSRDNFLIKETILIILGFAAFLIFLTNLLEHKKKFGIDKIGLFLIVFILIEFLSIFNSKFSELVFFTVIVHLCLLFAYFLSSQFNDSREPFLNIILSAGLMVSIYGILQYFNIDILKWNETYANRPSSSFGNPNFFAGYLVVIIPLALINSFSTRNTLKKYLFILLSVLSIADLFLTKTRGAWIAFIVSLIYIFIIMKLYRNKAILITVLAGMLILFFVFRVPVNSYLKDKFNPDIPSVAERIFKWKTAFEMVKERPLLGVGAGNLKVNFALYQAKIRNTAAIQLKGTSESNVHNEYLQIWAETGTFGLLSFLAIFILYFIKFFKQYNSNINSQHIAFSAGIVAFLTLSLSNFPLRIIPTSFLVFNFMGLTFLRENQAETNKKEGYQRNWFLRIIFFIVYATIVWKFAIIPFVADIARRDAAISLQTGNVNTAISKYEKAIRLDKVHSERTAYDLGEIYRKLGRYNDAIRAYSISVGVRNYGEVYNCIANCYWLENNFEMALKNWQIAAALGMPGPDDQNIVENNINVARKKLSHRNAEF